MSNPDLVTPKEMAEVLKVPTSWLYQRTRLGPGVIPFVKVGKYIRFNPGEVVQFLRNQQQVLTQK